MRFGDRDEHLGDDQGRGDWREEPDRERSASEELGAHGHETPERRGLEAHLADVGGPALEPRPAADPNELLGPVPHDDESDGEADEEQGEGQIHVFTPPVERGPASSAPCPWGYATYTSI